MPDQSINTGGGAAIEGDVHVREGDFVGRDKIVVGDVNASIMAIGDGAQIVYQSIERALTEVELVEQAQAFARRQLAEVVREYVDRLTREAGRAQEAAGRGNPYKALLEYDIDDAALFYGRARAKEALLDRLGRGPLTILHAESGAGKTSLLKAGLMPELLARGHVPLWLRPYRTRVDQEVKHQLLRQAEGTPLLAEASLHDLLGQVADLLGGKRLVILVDQFEEVFEEQAPEQRAVFLEQLARCLKDTLLPVHWVLALRGEYLSRLATFPRDLPNPFANEYLLQGLNREEARQVIVEPARARAVAYDPLVVNRILKDLDRGGIAPPQLQLVCWTLYDALEPGQAAIGGAMYEEGHAERILQDYLSRVIERDIVPERRRAARLILEALITSDGRRQQRTYRQLAGELSVREVEPGVLDELLPQVVESRLVRPVEGPEESGDPAYELTHDYLVGRIQLDPAVQARKAVQEMLERAVLDYRDQGILLDQDKFDAITARQDELVLDDVEARALMHRSERVLTRRRWLVRGGIGLVAALGVAAIVLIGLILGARQELADIQAQSTAAAMTVTVAGATADAAVTAVAATATAAAYAVQAEITFTFDDYQNDNGIPPQPIFAESASLEIAMSPASDVSQPLQGWSSELLLPDPAVKLASTVQSVDQHITPSVDGTEVTQINTFTDFVGELGEYIKPDLWNDATVEAILKVTSRDRWLLEASGYQWFPIDRDSFRAFYGIDEATEGPLADPDYQVEPVMYATLDIYVAGSKVASLRGIVTRVMEWDEDVRGLHVTRFQSQE
jgi:hypothetical protein